MVKLLFFFFFFSPLSRLHWPAHRGPKPQSERGRGDLIVHHLGSVTRWANIPYGWHGNGLLGLGWAVCHRQFLVIATFLQHPPDLNTENSVCFPKQMFYGGVLCLRFWFRILRRWNSLRKEREKVCGGGVILRLMRKWRVGRQDGDKRRSQIILYALPATEAERWHSSFTPIHRWQQQHTHKYTHSKPHSLFRSRACSHMLLQTCCCCCCCSESRSDCIRQRNQRKTSA